MKFIQLTDPHLSDHFQTPTWEAFRWAIDEVNDRQPDLLLVTGDITTYGNSQAARAVRNHLKTITVPVFFTPGNAEHRGTGTINALNGLARPKHALLCNHLLLFPDTSRGKITLADREYLTKIISDNMQYTSRIVATHYPSDTLEQNSQTWLERFLNDHQIELLVAGHKHIHRTRQIGSCTEIITRGLDPDKAIGDLPGISLFEKTATEWTETFLAWDFAVQLKPCSPAAVPVGWSIQGDPVAATSETRASGLSCLELRPKDLSFSMSALDQELNLLRQEQDLYLSWHLPNLSWNSESIQGIDTVCNQVSSACDIGANHLTVHVPAASSQAMKNPDLWKRFEDVYTDIFYDAVKSGIRLAIENVHNSSGVKPQEPACKFGTDIDSYLQWIEAVSARFDHAPNIGAHFDTGHARNNGEYGNMQPLAEWYARVGKHILGYHIHQIGTHPETGKTANHVEMHTLFDRRISYAGFCYAWSTRQINRAPLFVEIRDANQRRRSTRRLVKLFEQATIATSTTLPCRP